MKYRLSLFCFLLLSLFLQAQLGGLYFEKLTTQQGLSHNKVNCILQDKRGFVWIGTEDGLNRFDGKNMVRFRHRPNDTTTLSGNMITDLHEDREGILWIATADGGLSRYDYRLAPHLQFRQYRHDPSRPSSIPINIINAVLEDSSGHLWLATSGHSVMRFHKASGSFTIIPTRGTKTVTDICFDREGKIWAGRQGGGLLKIDPVGNKVEEDLRYLDLYAPRPHATITALHLDREKNMWFGSWDRILYRSMANTGKEENFHGPGDFAFRDDEIISFSEDAEGRIWMGGRLKGLQLYDPRTKRFYNYPYDPSREGSISDNQVNCIYRDQQGRMWVGTNKGACIYNPEKQQFVQNFLSNDPSARITVYDFFEDRKGNIWIGTSEGLFIRQPDGSLVKKSLRFRNNPIQVTQFFQDEAGKIYLGTDYSFFLYNEATSSLSLLPNTENDGVMKRIIDSRVVSVVQDEIEDRPVIITSPYGHFLTYYDLQQKQWVSRLDSSRNIVTRFNLKDNLIRRLYKAKDGTIWMATAKTGLGLWKKNSLPKVQYFTNQPGLPYSISSNNVFDLVEDANGNLWVSTFGGGLHHFNTKSGRFTQISGSNNLLEGLQTDRHGRVWMISNGNLHRYDPHMKSHSSFLLPDLEKSGGIKGRIFKDSKGRLYLPGVNYFISFDPDSIKNVISAPKVFLTDFLVFTSSKSHLLNQKEVDLKYKDNYFTIEFAAPDFSSGTEVRYADQLEGFNEDWVESVTQNRVSYSNLEGGRYRFRVKASNSPGVWSTEPATLEIVIIPPFWKKAWFFIACVLFAGIIVYFIYRYRINELLKRQAIRNKIAQDLHDNVGSTLSSISVYSQVAKIYHQQDKQKDLQVTLEKISATSSEMISELNDTVWAINPRNDSMAVMIQRMDSFARPLLAAQDTRFHFSYNRHIGNINLDMEKRKNLYLIFKESVNNALKYASCQNLYMTMELKGSFLHIDIRDDGKGFDLSATSEGYKSSDVYGGGNGLKNMQLRAREMKGKLSLISTPGAGTQVSLAFPIT